MNDQMIRVISSPSSSTTGFLTLILAIGARCYLPDRRRGDRCDRRDVRTISVPMAHRRAPQPSATTRSSTSRRRWSTTTSSRPTCRWSRRSRARAPSWARARDRAVGALRRRRAAQELGPRWPTRTSPKLRTHDRYGNRIDEVEFHPAWHELMAIGGRARAARARPGSDPQPGRPRRARGAASCCCRRPRPGSAARSR